MHLYKENLQKYFVNPVFYKVNISSQTVVCFIVYLLIKLELNLLEYLK